MFRADPAGRYLCHDDGGNAEFVEELLEPIRGCLDFGVSVSPRHCPLRRVGMEPVSTPSPFTPTPDSPDDSTLATGSTPEESTPHSTPVRNATPTPQGSPPTPRGSPLPRGVHPLHSTPADVARVGVFVRPPAVVFESEGAQRVRGGVVGVVDGGGHVCGLVPQQWGEEVGGR